MIIAQCDHLLPGGFEDGTILEDETWAQIDTMEIDEADQDHLPIEVEVDDIGVVAQDSGIPRTRPMLRCHEETQTMCQMCKRSCLMKSTEPSSAISFKHSAIVVFDAKLFMSSEESPLQQSLTDKSSRAYKQLSRSTGGRR